MRSMVKLHHQVITDDRVGFDMAITINPGLGFEKYSGTGWN